MAVHRGYIPYGDVNENERRIHAIDFCVADNVRTLVMENEMIHEVDYEEKKK